MKKTYELFEDRPTITRPAGVRISEQLNEWATDVPSVYHLGYNEIPPWTISRPIAHLECASFKKDETNPLIYKTQFLDFINIYREGRIIYTDGSKTEQGVGCGFACLGETYSWRLHPTASIYTAELYAIYSGKHYATWKCTKKEHT